MFRLEYTSPDRSGDAWTPRGAGPRRREADRRQAVFWRSALRFAEDIPTMVSKRASETNCGDAELQKTNCVATSCLYVLPTQCWPYWLGPARGRCACLASPAVAMTPCVVGAPPSARYQLPTHICMRTPRGVRLGKIPHFHPPTHAAARRRPPRIALIPVHPPTHASHRSLPPAAPRSRPASVGDRHRRRRRRDPEVRQLQAQEGG